MANQTNSEKRHVGFVYGGDRATFVDQMQDLTVGNGLVEFRAVIVPKTEVVAYLEASVPAKKEKK